MGPAHPLRGGLATYDERLCREFISMGFECEILSFKLQYPEFLFPGKSQFSSDSKPNDIKIHSLINSINPFNWFSLGRKFSKQNYDLVIFRYWLSFMAPAFGTIARQLKRNKKTKIIAITDNVIPHERRFFDTTLTKYFLNSCDGFLSMSREVFDQIENFVAGKPKKYVPHPMYDMFGETIAKSEAKKHLNLDENCKYILFFGFIRKYKGLKLLLESFADERLRKLNLKLIIAGEFYEDKKSYIELIEKLNLKNEIILRTDFIPNNEVGKYFSACDLVAQTYLNATQSGVTQIAYFYDKPMLVTNVGGLAELVPHDKVGYVANKNKVEIADSILDFYTNNREDFFIENIKIEKQKFTWNHLCEKLLEL